MKAKYLIIGAAALAAIGAALYICDLRTQLKLQEQTDGNRDDEFYRADEED